MKSKILSRNEKQRLAIKVTLIGSLVDTILGISKIIIGHLFHSHALVIDGIHSFSDLFTDGIVLFLGKLSHDAPDKNHPYGHERFETIGATALGSLLIGIGGALIYNTVQNLLNPIAIEPIKWPTFVVALISIISKEIIFRYSFQVGKQLKSKLLMANAWHSRTDAISSFVVLIGLIFSFYGYHLFDEVAALIVAVMITKIGWDFVKESLIELADTSVNRGMIKQIRECILEVDGVNNCHALRTRRMGPKILVDVNIEVASKLMASEGHEISSWVDKSLRDQFNDIEDVTVHLDIEDDRHSHKKEEDYYIHEYSDLLPLRSEVLKTLHTQWSDLFDLNKAREVRLHYINRKIDVEIILESKQDYNDQLVTQLNQTKQDIPWLGNIEFLFKKV